MANLLSRDVKAMVRPDGRLPAFTSLGGYPIIYLSNRDEVCCSVCANNPEKGIHLTVGDVHWEGEPLECEFCGAPIESAYGVPE